LCIAKGVLSKLRYYAPLSVLKNVYFSIAYSHLNYGITTWENAAVQYLNKMKVQQNFIVKIICKVYFYKTRVSPIYSTMNKNF